MDKYVPTPPRSDREKEIEFLRDALRRRVEQTSIRQVAAEVKMSHGGIYNLVTGEAAPYGKTLAKLRAWYLSQWAQGDEGLSTDTGRYLLRQMVAHMAPSVRGRAAAELLDAIDVLHRKYATPPPAWVHEVRRELRASAEGQKRGGSATGTDGS
jgi:AcrR family transcriptional regulator